jgi:hypothetical protein
MFNTSINWTKKYEIWYHVKFICAWT